jgi:alkylhydroperoxidase/carboxymuconolactone decarboxylase family protein YurZ
MLSPSQAAMYRRLTLGDQALLRSVFSGADGMAYALDERTSSLVRLAALVVVDADTPAYQCEIRDALGTGASVEQITAVLFVIARIAGSAVVMSAAPRIALALGYDVDAGLEADDARDISDDRDSGGR